MIIEADLQRLWSQYSILSAFRLEVPCQEERVSLAPEGQNAMYEETLRADLWLLFHPFASNILDFYRNLPSQITPNSIHMIFIFIILCSWLSTRLRVPYSEHCLP